MVRLMLRVNGTARAIEIADPDEPLLYVLRNDLRLTGVKFGCGLAQCGASEVPPIEVELIQRLDQPPVGVGEASSAPVPAALANAVFDATGVRFRTVPLRPDRVKAGLQGKPA